MFDCTRKLGGISNFVYVVLLRVTKQISLLGIKGGKAEKENRKPSPHGNEQWNWQERLLYILLA